MRNYIFLSFLSVLICFEAHAFRCFDVIGLGSEEIPEFQPKKVNYDKMLEKLFENKNYDNAIPFNEIPRDQYSGILKSAVAEAQEQLAAIEARPNGSFQDTILALEALEKRFSQVTSTISLIKSADKDPFIGATAFEAASAASNLSNQIIQSARLFEIIKRFRNDTSLGVEERRLIERRYKEFAQNGALLAPPEKKLLAEIDEQISRLGNKFSDNITDSTNLTFVWVAEKSELDGLSEATINEAAAEAKKHNRSGEYAIQMSGRNYIEIIKGATNRKLREKAYVAWLSRAKSGEHDNRNLVKEIVNLRAKKGATSRVSILC